MKPKETVTISKTEYEELKSLARSLTAQIYLITKFIDDNTERTEIFCEEILNLVLENHSFVELGGKQQKTKTNFVVATHLYIVNSLLKASLAYAVDNDLLVRSARFSEEDSIKYFRAISESLKITVEEGLDELEYIEKHANIFDTKKTKELNETIDS